MKVLEARFCPTRESNEGVVLVGLVVCEPGIKHPVVVPVLETDGGPSAWGPIKPELETRAMLAKLTYLVENSGPDPYEALLNLRSSFWRFTPRRSASRKA